MSNTLDRLVEMNEQIERLMAIEKARNEAIRVERAMLQNDMTEEIVADLKELRSYRKQLGIKKNMFESNIKMFAYDKWMVIGISVIGDSISINLCDKRDYGIARYSCFDLNEEYNIKHWQHKGMCDTVFKNWKTIKKNIEEQLVEEYFKQQTKKCKGLEQETINCLIGLKNTKEVLR